MDARGRACPLAYRYQPEALAQPPPLEAGTLLVVGGLYGNLPALQTVLQRVGQEPGRATVVFNGDFHWLDVGPGDFQAIGEMVLAHHAIKGNVEAELASSEDAGCGCAYPDYVAWPADDSRRRARLVPSRRRGRVRQQPHRAPLRPGLRRRRSPAPGGQQRRRRARELTTTA